MASSIRIIILLGNYLVQAPVAIFDHLPLLKETEQLPKEIRTSPATRTCSIRIIRLEILDYLPRRSVYFTEKYSARSSYNCPIICILTKISENLE